MKKIFIMDMLADEKYLLTIRNFFTESVKGSGIPLPVDDVDYLELAVNEFCENIIRYGYRGRYNGRILLKVAVESDRISVIIIDRGEPHNILEFDPASHETLVEKGVQGKLGIKMIKTVCDRIYYKRLKGKNKTMLVKIAGKKQADKKE
ncbi:MAG: ATP-binding protein [Spirochaetia bacterium]|nr:ATP-binding protein [Spirochaetia bacterium]